jgi:CRISPR/Cas system-associated exonuclease Cas4 (RecB family)|tara:strand:+ start:1013 stop:1714 length:702 start_codon:yes stop_codon:yes gene_type:complete
VSRDEFYREQNILPWSYSKIHDFEQCPKQFYHLNIVKDYEKEFADGPMKYGNEFHKAAEEYVSIGKALPIKFQYAESMIDALKAKRGEVLCEFKMGLTRNLAACDFWDQHVWWRGVADLVVVNEDARHAYAVDYKTGKSSKYADLDQLALMALGIFAHFSFVEEVRAGLLFVRAKDFIKHTYTKPEQSDMWDGWTRRTTRLKKACDTNVWNPNSSGLCKAHCPVTDCPHNGRN